MTDATVYVGPLSFAALAVPAAADLTGVVQELQRLRDAHVIEVLDLEVITCGDDGRAQRLGLSDPAVGSGLAGLAAIETDLLHDDDRTQIAAELGDGENALVFVYEDRSLAALAERIIGLGGREVWSGGIDATDLDEAAEESA